jgi:hypothetical protein
VVPESLRKKRKLARGAVVLLNCFLNDCSSGLDKRAECMQESGKNARVKLRYRGLRPNHVPFFFLYQHRTTAEWERHPVMRTLRAI